MLIAERTVNLNAGIVMLRKSFDRRVVDRCHFIHSKRERCAVLFERWINWAYWFPLPTTASPRRTHHNMNHREIQRRLNRINRRQIQLAGPRYTPGIDLAAPNLQIDSLRHDLGCLAFDDNFRGHITELEAGLTQGTEYLSSTVDLAFGRRKRTPAALQKALATLGAATPGDVGPTLLACSRTAGSVAKVLEGARSLLFERLSSASDDEERRRIDGKLGELLRVQSSVRPITEFLASDARRLLTDNRLFLVGDWGTGKTHFLCDMARRRMDDKLPTLLVLGQHLPPGKPPLQALCQATGIASSPEELLVLLQRLGRLCRQRALLVIDGINEGDQDEWRSAMSEIAEAISAKSNVGIIASCRLPFDERIMSKRARPKWVTVVHPGFGGVEFDAQIEFFKFYRIPAPQTPLLTPEFSRPLFLKIFCETIRDLTGRGQKKYLRDIASGQKGMTKALEDFVKHIGQKIEKDFQLPPLTCWRLLKGDKINGNVQGIAPLMSDSLRDYVTRTEPWT